MNSVVQAVFATPRLLEYLSALLEKADSTTHTFDNLKNEKVSSAPLISVNVSVNFRRLVYNSVFFDHSFKSLAI